MALFTYMINRQIKLPKDSSFFLFGPRGTGKSYLIRENYKDSIYIDLLESETYRRLLARPDRLEEYISVNRNNPDRHVIIDEVQRIPNLLNEVHRIIEKEKVNFILTGSSSRKLKRAQANLLAGRALKFNLYPLTLSELQPNIDFQKILKYGLLPSLYDDEKDLDFRKYLESYVQVYLEEEIMQEGLTRNLDSFSRFLETTSFSQGQQLNVSNVAREASINRKVAESYFNILYDLLIAYRLPIFNKHAKRKLISQNKFYFFDIGIYSTIKPKGFLDSTTNEEGIIYESLVLQELIAVNANLEKRYNLGYWRTRGGVEVDFVLYGEKDLIAIEVKRKDSISNQDLRGLLSFKQDYPTAKLYAFYGGKHRLIISGVEVIPIQEALANLPNII
jgi:uncharacterized protein